MPILKQEPALFPENLFTHLDTTSTQVVDSQDDLDKRVWWVVYTRSRREKSLARKLFNAQVPFYLPLVCQQHVYRGKRVKSYLPLFSNYLFMCSNEDERVTALMTNDISKMIPVEDPGSLLKDLINLSQLIDAQAPITVEQCLEPGQAVRIKSGPMKGVEGVIVDRRGKERLIVSVDYIRQGVSMDVSDFMVEPI